MKADKDNFYFKYDSSDDAKKAIDIIYGNNTSYLDNFYYGMKNGQRIWPTSLLKDVMGVQFVGTHQALSLLQPFDRNNFCVDIQKEKDSPLLSGFKEWLIKNGHEGIQDYFGTHNLFGRHDMSTASGRLRGSDTPIYTLAELQSHMPEIWEGEAQWKPKQNDRVQFYQCGDDHTGEIIVIYKNNAWIEVDGWETPMTVDVDRLRPVKTLRDEIYGIVYLSNNSQAVCNELTDRIMALIEQRKGKG